MIKTQSLPRTNQCCAQTDQAYKVTGLTTVNFICLIATNVINYLWTPSMYLAF